MFKTTRPVGSITGALCALVVMTAPALALSFSNLPSKFNIPWGSSAISPYIRSVPQGSQIGIQNCAASLTTGFPPLTFTPPGQGGCPPFGADMNGILNQITLWSQWQAAGSPVQYDATFSSNIGGYPKGTVLGQAATLGCYWLSTTDNNTTNPDSSGAGWQGYCISTAPSVTYITSGAGTYTTPSGTTYLKIRMIGGGGGGAAAGVGGASGNSGSATTISTYTAGGGQPGQNSIGGSDIGVGGPGGTVSGVPSNFFQVAGGSGTGSGTAFGTSVQPAFAGGPGGSSCVGGNGGGGDHDVGPPPTTPNGYAGVTGTGGGGGGGGIDGGTINPWNSGGGGGAGGCAEVYITSPAATYPYAIGTGGGGGGGAPAGAGNGGTGGNGSLLIEAHFGS
jgi:hypothetical protein